MKEINKMEIKNFKNYEESYIEDDEIDLIELFRILVKHKLTILLTFVIVAIISIIIAFYNIKNNKIVETIIQYDYEKISDGKNPDNSNFLKSNILPVSILSKIYEKYNFNNEFKNFSAFRAAVNITGIVPSEILEISKKNLSEGKVYSYTPSQYTISLKTTDTKSGKLALEEAVNEGINSYIEKYSIKEINPILDIKEGDFKSYSYQNFIKLFDNFLTQLSINIELSAKNKQGVSTLEYNYSDLKLETELIKDIDLRQYKSLIQSDNISKNIELEKKEYYNEIKILERVKKEQIEKIKLIKNILDSYKPSSKQIVFQSVELLGAGLNTGDEYYSKLTQQYLDESVKISSIDGKINYYKENILNLRLSSKEEDREIFNLTNSIINKINNLTNKLNNLNFEYNKKDNDKIVRKIIPVIVKSTNKAKLILAVGLMLGLFLGVLLAFIKNFIKNIRTMKLP